MVLYHPNGRVILAHENYLEQLAHEEATEYGYEDQIDICNARKATSSTKPIRIVIETQFFKTLYCHNAESWGTQWEYLGVFDQPDEEQITADLERETWMRCSTLAEEHFRFNPGEDVLHLPVRYPRRQGGGCYVEPPDDQMAYIRSHEIKTYIIPWLVLVQAQLHGHENLARAGQAASKRVLDRSKGMRTLPNERQPTSQPPPIMIPKDLLEKIHLYNAMLQLGLPKFIQQPLVDALILQMYRENLKECHLSTLEMTIGRFYSRGIAILDPVFCHFIGTYAFRSRQDRADADSSEPLSDPNPTENEDEFEKGCEPTDFSATKRKYLDYAEHDGNRVDFPDDTFILPPQLPVLGHNIRHWSGLRRDGSAAAAHTGFPLNIGRAKKFIRRDATTAIDENDVVVKETNRLSRNIYYRNFPPGQGDISSDSDREEKSDG